MLNLGEADYAPSEETSEEKVNRLKIELGNMTAQEKIAVGELMKEEDSDFLSA